MVRGKDACWNHCVVVDATQRKVRCNYCHREISGGLYRMKFHLAQIKNKEIVPCTEVPDGVRDLFQSILSTPETQKSAKKPKNEHAPEHSSSAASGCNVKNAGSSGQHGSTSPSPGSYPTADDAQKQKYDDADNKIAEFFLHNSIPFSASESIHYQDMVEAIANCGAGYKPPTCDGLRSTFLDKIKEEINENYRKLKDEWKDTGCTILSDSWSDPDDDRSSLLLFSVASPKGTHFLRLVDTSSRADDACYLFELLDSVIMEVGAENVVQVITDSVTSYAITSDLLLKKYPSIFWSPCAWYCIEKMLEDISQLEWVSTALEEARSIEKFICSEKWILNRVKNSIGWFLHSPRLPTSVIPYVTLRSIVIQEDKLKRVFSHPDLLSCFNRRPDAQAIKKSLFLERFWNASHEIKAISEPLLKLLRLVDGDMPAIGYIYEGIERAKLSIKTFYKGCEEKYMPVLDIIEKRWSVQLHSHLHSAAAFLNPSVLYNQSFKLDATVRNGFYEAMWKMFPEENDRIELIKEQPVYLNAQGALGSKFAIMGRSLNSPGDWWTAFGYEVPVMQRAAVRILSQPCSSYWFKWDWSTFEDIYAEDLRNWELEKLNYLLFLQCNLRLQTISESRDAKCRPVVYDEIDVSSKWPTEDESLSFAFHDSWLDKFIMKWRGGSSTLFGL